MHHSCSLAKEVRSRVAMGWSAFRKRQRAIFSHGHVPLSDKASLLQTLVLSTMLHGCGTWSTVEPEVLAPIGRAYVHMARLIFAKHYKGDPLHVGEDRILAHLGLPPLIFWIHFHRLTYLTSFMTLGERCGPWPTQSASGFRLRGAPLSGCRRRTGSPHGVGRGKIGVS